MTAVPFKTAVLADTEDSDCQEWQNAAAPDRRPAEIWLRQDLDLSRLHKLHYWLAVIGRPGLPEPLHSQKLLGRQIQVVEQADMHLVEDSKRIFIKPLPIYLLDPRVWTESLSCRQDCACIPEVAFHFNKTEPRSSRRLCEQRTRRGVALGLLFSYVALIQHCSDFRMAEDARLIPTQLSWRKWNVLVQELLSAADFHQHIDDRFAYGELRLRNLNLIYCIANFDVFNGYWFDGNTSRDIVDSIFKLGALWLVCIATVMWFAPMETLATEMFANKIQAIGPALLIAGLLGLAVFFLAIRTAIFHYSAKETSRQVAIFRRSAA